MKAFEIQKFGLESLVMVERLCSVPVFLMVMVAPGITAPLGSVTVPRKLPVVLCAHSPGTIPHIANAVKAHCSQSE